MPLCFIERVFASLFPSLDGESEVEKMVGWLQEEAQQLKSMKVYGNWKKQYHIKGDEMRTENRII